VAGAGLQFRVPREKIPWNPTVDPEKCTGCKTCFSFCPHKTYTWNEATCKPVVSYPTNCVPGCSNCAAKCPQGAISFPPLAILKQYM
jgi:NAD-dependent dihydropyrimidine dehydrogenase PreA subunit